MKREPSTRVCPMCYHFDDHHDEKGCNHADCVCMCNGTITKFRQIRHRNESGELMAEVFARDDNGMIVGAAEVTGVAKFGEDFDHAMVRWFVSREYALAWVKEQCKRLAGRDDVDFLIEESGSRLVTPERK